MIEMMACAPQQVDVKIWMEMKSARQGWRVGGGLIHQQVHAVSLTCLDLRALQAAEPEAVAPPLFTLKASNTVLCLQPMADP